MLFSILFTLFFNESANSSDFFVEVSISFWRDAALPSVFFIAFSNAFVFSIVISKLLWIPTSNGFPNVFVNAFPRAFVLFVVTSKLLWIDVILPSSDFILSLNGFPNAFFPRITADLVASSFIFIRDETISFKPREIVAAPVNSAIVFSDFPIPPIKRSDWFKLSLNSSIP